MLILLLLLGLLSLSYSGENQKTLQLEDPVIEDFVRLVNEKRRSLGCPELSWDRRIASIASGHSRDMATRGFFSHTNPDGKDLVARLKASKVGFSAVGENIAYGPKTSQEAYDTWLGSPEHRKNMIDCRFTHHGVGRVKDRWTHVLLKP